MLSSELAANSTVLVLAVVAFSSDQYTVLEKCCKTERSEGVIFPLKATFFSYPGLRAIINCEKEGGGNAINTITRDDRMKLAKEKSRPFSDSKR